MEQELRKNYGHALEAYGSRYKSQRVRTSDILKARCQEGSIREISFEGQFNKRKHGKTSSIIK